MTLKQALWEIVRDENIIITNQNIDWLLDRSLKKASGDAQALKESVLERKEKLDKLGESENKSNEELFKKALLEGINRRIDKTIEEEKRIEQIEEMAKIISKKTERCGVLAVSECIKRKCEYPHFAGVTCRAEHQAEALYNAGYRKLPDNIGDFSDGYHTFNELYHHRAVLFSVICNVFPEKAWKSKLHDTGDMYDGMFIVGIETEQGQATYHYDIEPYWDMFKVKELEKAPKWDGHTPSDAIQRIGNIKQSEGEWNDNIIGFCNVCMNCGAIVERSAIKNNSGKLNFCSNCGSKMKGGN